MPTFNVKNSSKICAFCKYWYDPTNSVISPKEPRLGIWNYDANATNVCTKRGGQHRACIPGCPDYECKIPR